MLGALSSKMDKSLGSDFFVFFLTFVLFLALSTSSSRADSVGIE